MYENILSNSSHENFKLFKIKEMIKSKAKVILSICSVNYKQKPS